MQIPALFRRLLCGLCLWQCGCVTVQDPAHVAQPQPPSPSLLDRVLRRTSLPAMAEYHQPIEAAAPDPKNPARLSVAYAKLMEEAGNLVAAESHYNRALEENSESLDALVGLGRVHQLAGRYEAAEQSFNRALKQDPDFAPALHGLGETYAARNRWDEAVALLDKAVLAAPADNSMRYDLAVALVHTGNIDAALPHFIRTVGDAEAHYNIGLILQREGRLIESEQQLQLALVKKPDLDEARYWLGIVQQQQSLPAVPPTVTQSAGAATGGIQQTSYEAPQTTLGSASGDETTAPVL